MLLYITSVYKGVLPGSVMQLLWPHFCPGASMYGRPARTQLALCLEMADEAWTPFTFAEHGCISADPASPAACLFIFSV